MNLIKIELEFWNQKFAFGIWPKQPFGYQVQKVYAPRNILVEKFRWQTISNSKVYLPLKIVQPFQIILEMTVVHQEKVTGKYWMRRTFSSGVLSPSPGQMLHGLDFVSLVYFFAKYQVCRMCRFRDFSNQSFLQHFHQNSQLNNKKMLATIWP